MSPDILGILFKSRRKDTPWEVVGSRSVEPVPMYYDDEDLNIDSIDNTDTSGTYVFDVKHLQNGNHFRNTLVFARQQLLQAIMLKDFNILLQESWTITVLRRGKHYRVRVRYSGRAARVLDKPPPPRSPPFIDVLNGYAMS